MKKDVRFLDSFTRILFASGLLLPAFFFQACDRDDPSPVNEEEVITTLNVALVPEGGGVPINLKFYDADGEHGSIAPVISASGALAASTHYAVAIELLNETVSPVEDISQEVAEEANDHLFCFNVDGDVSVQYEDEDENGMPLGLITSWVTGSAGEATVAITLRHQSGTKTGACPGTGETDVEVAFDLLVE